MDSLLCCCTGPGHEPDSHSRELGTQVRHEDPVRIGVQQMRATDTDVTDSTAGPGKVDSCRYFQKSGWCRNGDSCRFSHPGPDMEYVDNFPVLPSQLEMFDGSWDWIRRSNDAEHRTARRAAGLQLREAFKRGGYAVWYEDHKHKVPFEHIPEMLRGTTVLSASEGLPALRKDPHLKLEFHHGGAPIERAIELTLQGFRTCCVNPASAHHVGGGFTSGGRHALEESLCSQSTLFLALEKTAQKHGSPHIPEDGVMLAPRVELFRRGSDQGYPLHYKAVPISGIVSVAMYNKNPRVSDSPVDAPADEAEYRKGVRLKFQAVVRAATMSGCNALVLPDVGCGVFGNDPAVVGSIAGDAIRECASYFSRLNFTGSKEFFNAAAESLTKSPAPRPIKVARYQGAMELQKKCIICMEPLSKRTELALLLNPVGRRAQGLQFLHAACAKRVEEKWPDHSAMTLPQATRDPASFLRALDVTGEGILTKDEVLGAIIALKGDEKEVINQFEEQWNSWDKDESGDLTVNELTELPQVFFGWLRSSSRLGSSRGSSKNSTRSKPLAGAGVGDGKPGCASVPVSAAAGDSKGGVASAPVGPPIGNAKAQNSGAPQVRASGDRKVAPNAPISPAVAPPKSKAVVRK